MIKKKYIQPGINVVHLHYQEQIMEVVSIKNNQPDMPTKYDPEGDNPANAW